MRIGLICDEYPPRQHGGIGTFVSGLAQELAGRGHVVRVYEFGLSDVVRLQGGVQVHTIPRSRLPKFGVLLDRWCLRRTLNEDIARGELDVVETPDFLGFLPLRLDPRCAVVVRLHGSLTVIAAVSGLRTPPVLSALEWLTLRAHRDWVGVSQHAIDLVRRAFPRAHPGRTAVSCPFVDVTEEPREPNMSGDEDGRPLPSRFLLHAGTVSDAKGVVFVATAVRPVLSHHPDLHVVFAGRVVDGPKGATRTRIRDALGPDVSARCHFTGHRPRREILGLIRRCSVFLSASRFETFGLSVAEAMALRCAVVVPSEPPFTEWITPEETGLLVTPSDPGEFAGAIERLLASDALRRRLGDRAADFVRTDLSLERFVDRTLDLYKEAVARGGNSLRSRTPNAMSP